MTFLEKLDCLMEEKSIGKADLSRISGVPYTTIDGFYKKGYKNAKISTIRKIANALGVSLDYLVGDSDEAAAVPNATPFTEEALTADMERLLQSLTPEQARLLCSVASRWMETVKAKADEK